MKLFSSQCIVFIFKPKVFKPVYPPISLWVRPIPEVANDNAETMEEGRPSDLLSFLSESNKTSEASILLKMIVKN